MSDTNVGRRSSHFSPVAAIPGADVPELLDCCITATWKKTMNSQKKYGYRG